MLGVWRYWCNCTLYTSNNFHIKEKSASSECDGQKTRVAVELGSQGASGRQDVAATGEKAGLSGRQGWPQQTSAWAGLSHLRSLESAACRHQVSHSEVRHTGLSWLPSLRVTTEGRSQD